MSTFIELVVNGVSAGSVYALIALGFVIIFKATEVVNFAHASLLLVGGYVTAVLHDDIGFLRRSARASRPRPPPGRWWSCWCCGAHAWRTTRCWRSSPSASTSC